MYESAPTSPIIYKLTTMKNKIINMFDDPKIVQNAGAKYSELLEKFMTPFASDFDKMEFYEDIIDFGVAAWNFGNLKLLMPEPEFNAVIDAAKSDKRDVRLLLKMVSHKISEFNKYTNFIVDYELTSSPGEAILSVMTQEEDAYLAAVYMMSNLESSANPTQEDFEENFINRSSITLTAREPFIEWIAALDPNGHYDQKAVTTYLVSEEIQDLELWLKKKYDKLFILELEAWSTNKKAWPQKRSHKMFTEWFTSSTTELVYDLVKKPVFKT